MPVADLGEAPGGPDPLILSKNTKKKSQKEEKPAGQAKQNRPPPTPPKKTIPTIIFRPYVYVATDLEEP